MPSIPKNSLPEPATAHDLRRGMQCYPLSNIYYWFCDARTAVRPKTNTRVTSRKLTRRGCGRHQCQIGFPISCGCNHHEINARHIHRTAPHRLKPI